MNTNVNFEIAKLLLDKGYDRIVSSAYHKATSKLIFTNWETVETNDDILIPAAFNLKEDSYLISAPTIAEVVMWLYEKHGIWIYAYPVQPIITDDEEYPKIVWVVKCLSMSQIMFEKFINSDNGLAINHHHSLTEAYSSAIEYILKKIIK